nr:hypothetical protein [Tanacetum cinerariifolium]
MSKFTIKFTDKATLKEYDLKSTLYQTMHKNKSFNLNLANHILYNALMKALIEHENAMDKGVANTIQDHKRKHDDDKDDDDDEYPPARPNQESLKTYDPKVAYTTSITKTKAARYKIKGIEDMVPIIWSTIKHVYDKDAEKGIKHWDMLLLAVQHKLSYLDGSDIVDFIVALRMFTRSLIIKRRVKDLQHGVKSYQKKLNITKPQKTFPEIEFKEPYTPSYNPPGQ